MAERLQKIMAHANVASRRECEKLIEEGKVRVNGRTAHLGDKADPATDRIEVNGRAINAQQVAFVYIALNKPKGVLSSLEDEMERDRKTVRDLIPLPGHLYPIGRLDKQSEGLMLMTNDGDMAHRLTHPRYGHEKTYRVSVEGRIPPEALETWREGLFLDDQKTAPVEIWVVRQEMKYTLLEIVMREGRKRQIRRIANILGYPVTHLLRVKIGPLDLGNLKSGEWRHLSRREVDMLRQEVAAKPAGRKPKFISQRGRPARRDPGSAGRKRNPYGRAQDGRQLNEESREPASASRQPRGDGRYPKGSSQPPRDPKPAPRSEKRSGQLAPTKSSANKPAANKPTATKPSATKPSATKPSATKPSATKPANKKERS
jgi:pseudouridine synthase